MKVEAKIDELLIPRLLNRGVQLHSRRAFRRGCLCSYCVAKRLWTRRVATVNLDPIARPYTSYYERYLFEDNWEIHARVVGARNREIKKAREDLESKLKE